VRSWLKWAIWPVGSLALAIGAWGCGGESEETSTTAVSPAKTAFIAKAGAACKRERIGLAEETASFLREHGDLPPEELYAELAHRVLVPVVELEVFRIEQMVIGDEVPPGDAEQVDKLLDFDRLAIDAAAVRQQFPSIEAVYATFSQAGKLFHAYGLPECANGPARAESVSPET